MELHCSALVNGGNILTAEHKERQKKKKIEHGNLSGLTYDHGVWAVPLGVLLAPSHTAGAGFCLVGAQGLPLTLQTVLVLQVVLHVRLEENRHHLSSNFKQQARTIQKSAEFISKYGCKKTFCVCKFEVIKQETNHHHWLSWDRFLLFLQCIFFTMS